MRNNDYYQVLGLRPTCTAHEIKKSYRQLALIWHPDKHNNKKEAQNKFTSINEAYNVLIDINKRRIYDDCGHEGLNSTQDGSTKSKNKFFEKGFYGSDKSAFDVFKDIFQENDEDDFFKTFDLSGMCNNMKANIETFVYEQVIPSEGEDEEGDFFADYMPTFMNTAFTSTLSSLNQFCTGGEISTEFFSAFFADSFDNESNKKEKTSAKKKGKKSKKTAMEDDNEHENSKYKTSKPSCPSNSRKAEASKSRKNSKDYFVINSGNGMFEEELHIEFNLVGQKRKLSFSIDILEETNSDVFAKKSQRKNSLKRKNKKSSVHEGRKKVKK